MEKFDQRDVYANHILIYLQIEMSRTKVENRLDDYDFDFLMYIIYGKKFRTSLNWRKK